MNTIQVDLRKLPPDVREWVNFEIAASNASDIAVKLLNKRHVPVDSIKCAGYFCEADEELVVAAAVAQSEWVPIMVHESCHRDQYVEQIPLWNKKIILDGEKQEPLNLMHDWLGHRIELKPRKLREVLLLCGALELDCEKRSAKKIDQFYLPINSKEYIQKANAYIYMYSILHHTRRWYKPGNGPFARADIWTKMPTDFDRDYAKVPTKIKDLILDNCF